MIDSQTVRGRGVYQHAIFTRFYQNLSSHSCNSRPHTSSTGPAEVYAVRNYARRLLHFVSFVLASISCSSIPFSAVHHVQSST